MMKYLCAVVLLSVLVFGAFAQRAPRHTISGYVTDSLSSESLIGATVYDKTNMTAASTNRAGFYSLTLPEGRVELVYSYMGYRTQVFHFQLYRDTVINLNLAEGHHLQEAIVTAALRTGERSQMSLISMPIAQIKSLPAALGVTDVMRALQLTPGIQSGNEGSTGLHVRGGSPDQNLVLLDGVPIYNTSHLLGFVSMFNGDAINSMEAYKGGFPARYGGRVSSVLDISMKEGNMQKFRGEGAIGLLWSNLTLEGPIVKDRTSFIVSGRRTYADLLMRPALGALSSMAEDPGSDAHINMQGEISKAGFYFYDLTAKINHKFSDESRIYLSAYMGDDKMYGIGKYKYEHDNIISGTDKMDFSMQWGNFMTTLRWNYVITNRLFVNTALAYSRFRDNFSRKNDREQTHSVSGQTVPVHNFSELRNNYGIQDRSGRIAFDYIPSPNHYVRFGAGAIYHTFNPGRVSLRDTTGSRDFGASKRYAWEYSVYVEDDIRLTERLKTNVGLHWSAYGMGDSFYNVWQPRISTRYLISPQLSAKASYSRMAQYVHLLTNNAGGFPRDLWVPATELLRPQKADQIALGFVHNHREDYEISLEGYYKTLTNVLDYREGSSFLNIDEDWEQKLLQGTGRSYGMELFAEKKSGSFTGWAGYTLSWSDRHFDELNDGKRFPYKYDRRHDFSIVLMQRIKREKRDIDVSITWVYSSGNCITLPVGVFDVNHPILTGAASGLTYQYIEYGERNGYRMEPYHRLDASLSFIKQRKWGESRWVWSVYNAYNRKNPYHINIEKDRWGEFRFMQYSLFPIIPSLSFRFKF